MDRRAWQFECVYGTHLCRPPNICLHNCACLLSVHAHMHMCIHMPMCVPRPMSVQVSMCAYLCAYLSAHIFTPVCADAHVYVSMCKSVHRTDSRTDNCAAHSCRTCAGKYDKYDLVRVNSTTTDVRRSMRRTKARGRGAVRQAGPTAWLYVSK